MPTLLRVGAELPMVMIAEELFPSVIPSLGVTSMRHVSPLVVSDEGTEDEMLAVATLFLYHR